MNKRPFFRDCVRKLLSRQEKPATRRGETTFATQWRYSSRSCRAEMA